MASVPGGTFDVFDQSRSAVNIGLTTPGNDPPPPKPGLFNVEVIQNATGTGFTLFPGYDALITTGTSSSGGKLVTLLQGDIGVTDTTTGGQKFFFGTGNQTVVGASNDTMTGSTVTGAQNTFDASKGTGIVVQAGAASTTITGGNDATISGGSGNTSIDGSAGNQLITAGSSTATTILGGANDTVQTGTGNASITLHASGAAAGPEFIQDPHSSSNSTITGSDTVLGFNPNTDQLSYAGETHDPTGQDPNSIEYIILHQDTTTKPGSTILHLPDGTAITLVGISSAGTLDPNEQTTPSTDIGVFDSATGKTIPVVEQTYSGPVGGIQHEFILTGNDPINISVSTDNWFLHGGSSDDALAAHGGYNVLDGGGGSNFLTGGGTGTDTFFLDDRNLHFSVWSTANNFHIGDDASVFGILPTSDIQWADNQGATGYTGLTLHLPGANGITASLTLTGYSTADLSNGRLTVQFGNEPDNTPFMHIIANS